jgi:hypothetical protein
MIPENEKAKKRLIFLFFLLFKGVYFIALGGSPCLDPRVAYPALAVECAAPMTSPHLKPWFLVPIAGLSLNLTMFVHLVDITTENRLSSQKPSPNKNLIRGAI